MWFVAKYSAFSVDLLEFVVVDAELLEEDFVFLTWICDF